MNNEAQFATKLDLELLRTEMHKELSNMTRWIVTILAIQTTVILGAVYFLLGDIKADLRDLRAKIPALKQ